MVAIGGLVEIAPLFYLESTIEKVEGMRPYTPLELAGRNIYVREGCYVCHSQMIRTFRDEVERYGHYSLAAESMYDHPFQWGSERTGPDLARVGGKYSDEWHRAHLHRSARGGAGIDHAGLCFPRPDASSTIATSPSELGALRTVGVPYTDERSTMPQPICERRPIRTGRRRRALPRYPKAQARDFDGNPAGSPKWMRLIAYLQMLGTLVDFKNYDDSRQEPEERWIADYEDVRSNSPQSWGALFRGASSSPCSPTHSGPRNQKRFDEAARHPVARRTDRSSCTRKSTHVRQRDTTGHEWDGIKELNTPLPRWWLWPSTPASCGRSATGSCCRRGPWFRIIPGAC